MKRSIFKKVLLPPFFILTFLSLSLASSRFHLRISAESGVAFQGKVTDPDDNPVENAIVEAFPADPSNTAPPAGVATDANGDYSISAAEVTSGETYYLEVFPPQSGAGSNLISPGEAEQTYNGTTITQNFKFVAATKTISGTVTLSSNNSAVANARVNAFKREGAGFVQTTTDSAGEYTLTVSGGSWEVMPEATSNDNWAYGQPPETAKFANDTSVESTTINFSVDPATATITGRVLRPNGDPVNQSDGVGIGVFNQEGKGGGGPVNNDGTFSIKVPAGTFMVGVWTPPDSDYGAPSLPRVTVKDNETSNLGNITLVTRNATITGSVKDESNNGVSGVFVEAFVRDGGGFAEAQTDGSGNFQLKVTAGRWMVMPRLNPSASYALSDPPEEVSVSSGGTATVNFTLQNATATIQGVLQDDGRPPSTVSAYGYAFAEVSGQGMFGPAGLGGPVERGSFSFKVPAGTYDVNVGLAPGSSYTPGAATAVTVADGETKNIVITLKSNNATITGSVVDDSGKLITGLGNQLFVFAIANNHTFQEGVVSGSSYTINVAAGEWALGFFIDPSTGYMSAPPDPSSRLTVTSGQSATKNIVLKRADATITGRVTESDGTTAATGVFVSVDNRETEGKEFFNGTPTDSNGNYELKIASGSYKVRVNVDPGTGNLSPPEKTVTVASGETKTANFSLRQSDATISGTVTLAGSGAGVAAFVYAWSDDGGFAQAIANASGGYTLAVSQGTTWHVGARYESGTTPYEATEAIVNLTGASSATADLTLAQLTYTLPQSLTVTFSATQPKLISLTDGTEINIPANALATSGNVTLTVNPKTSLPSKKGDKPVWYGYEFTATDSSGQTITTFNSSITVTFPYTDAQLAGLGITADDLIPSYWDSTSGTWKKVSNVTVNTTTKRVTITINHFTDFALTANIAGGTATTATTSTSTSSTTTSMALPAGCDQALPGSKAPLLYAALPEGENAIRLYFTEADGPLDRYVLAYGLDSAGDQYGAENIGGPGTRTYLVQSLAPKTTYHFRVRAGNGCAPGPWSNQILATTGLSGQPGSLDLVTTGVAPVVKKSKRAESKKKEEKCTMHTVKPGDTLWSLAAKYLGSGSQYRKIVELNQEKYPGVASGSLTVGSKLKISCQKATGPQKADRRSPPAKKEITTYLVRVKVVDLNQKPVVGAKVVLYSRPREAVTNEKGIAEILGVEPGEHRIVVSYRGYQGEQTINLGGEVAEFNLNIQIQPGRNYQLIIVVLGGLGLVLAAIFILWQTKRLPFLKSQSL